MHNKVAKNIKFVFFLNLFFAILELLGSFYTNSISILSDAVHDFGDAISIGISYIFEKKASKHSNNKYTFGYLRFSLVGALITSLILILGSFLVIYNAIPRIINPQEINYNGMIIFAFIGVVINGLAVYKTAKGNNINEKAINLHLLEDVLGWIAVLISSFIIKIFNLPIIDPILSIVIGVYILFHAIKHVKEISEIFLDKIPDNIDISNIKRHLKDDFKDIIDIHHIHIWTLDGINNQITMHVKINDNMSKDKIILLKKEIKKKLAHEKLNHATIEFEYQSEFCDDL